jgi:hypothetical protein
MDKLTFDAAAFTALLRTLIGHTESLQNSPPDLIPKVSLASGFCCDLLERRRFLVVFQ